MLASNIDKNSSKTKSAEIYFDSAAVAKYKNLSGKVKEKYLITKENKTYNCVIYKHSYPGLNDEYKNIVPENELETKLSIVHYKRKPFSGVSFRSYNNNQIKAILIYKDGKLDGETKEWHKNGQLKVEKIFKHSQQVGEYKSFHENGRIAEEGIYKLFTKQDYFLKKDNTNEVDHIVDKQKLVEFNRVSRLIARGDVASLHMFLHIVPKEAFGYKHGIVKKYNKDGKLIEEMLFNKGEKVNNDEIKWEEVLNVDGKIYQRYQYLYEKNFKHGLCQSFIDGNENKMNNETTYLLSKKEGVSKHYFGPKGLFYGDLKFPRPIIIPNMDSTLTYEENKRCEKEVYGKLHMELTYKNDELNGLARSWNKKGQLEREVRYINGKREGILKKWKNNKLIREEKYEEGIRIGSYTLWYENGQLRQEGTYKSFNVDDKGFPCDEYTSNKKSFEHGITKYYNDKGNLDFEVNYNKGDDGIKYPTWKKYYRGKVEEKFNSDLTKILEKNKIKILKMKAKKDWEEILLHEKKDVFFHKMNIYQLFNQFLENGAKKFCGINYFKKNQIIDDWKKNDGWSELEMDAYSNIHQFWIKLT